MLEGFYYKIQVPTCTSTRIYLYTDKGYMSLGLHFRLQVRFYDGLRVPLGLPDTSRDLVRHFYNEGTIDPHSSTGQEMMSRHGRGYSFHMLWNNRKWRQCGRHTVDTSQHADAVRIVVNLSLQVAVNTAA